MTKRNIVNKSLGKAVFHNTDYIVLANGHQWAVIRIQKTKNSGMLKRIEMIEIVALPEAIKYVEDPTVNVNSPSQMARIAEREAKETVVVKGEFEHISFMSNEKPISLAVFDFTPPDPPKLIELVERALDTGRIRKPIKIIPKILDLNRLAKSSNKPFVMFPCYTYNSNCDKNIMSLVGIPDISSINIEDIALIGCDVSLRMFKSIYGKTPTFIDMCPLHRKEVRKKRGMKSIARCDKIQGGHFRLGDTAYVSFDATLYEVEEAILDLFELKSVGTPIYKTLPPRELLSGLARDLLRVFRTRFMYNRKRNS